MAYCSLCGEEAKPEQDLEDNNHQDCLNLSSERSDRGKCVDCGIGDTKEDLPCGRCKKFGSRLEARRANGYLNK